MKYTENEVKTITDILTDRVFHINRTKGRTIARIDDSADSLKYEVSFTGDKTFTVTVAQNDNGIHLIFEGTNIKDYQFLADFFNSSFLNFKNEKGKLSAYFKIVQKKKEEQ